MDAGLAGVLGTRRMAACSTRRGREPPAPGLLPARLKPMQDTPTPSPNGVAGIVCARLHELTDDPRWRERRRSCWRAFAGRAAELGLHAAAYLLALDWQLNPATHLVVVGAARRSDGRGHAPRRRWPASRRAGWSGDCIPADRGAAALPPLRAMVGSGSEPRGLRVPRHALQPAG